jgi:protein gp37
MAENSGISWTDNTFNPWMGCTKVSPACKFCYAERDMDHRHGKVAWGPSGTRVLTSDQNWQKPVKWNREADKSGKRLRVFCASLADVFEDWQGPIVGPHGNRIAVWPDGSQVAGIIGSEHAATLINGKYCTPDSRDARIALDSEVNGQWDRLRPTAMARVGKKAAGRELDGVVHDAFPMQRES